MHRKPPIRKKMCSQKKRNESTSAEFIVCDDSGDDAGDGEGVTVVNSLEKKSE